MTASGDQYRLYSDLARWWPVISPPAEYAAEAEVLAGVLRSVAGTGPRRTRTVLDLGCGGGHIARHLDLAGGFELTLTDISPRMLEVSARLNPGLEHLQGDMRALRLGRRFDAVLVHDAADYITDAGDLRLVAATAFEHTRPGGLAVFTPDHLRDTFTDITGTGGGQDGTGRSATFTERTTDPDPDDDWVLAEYEFTLREPDGSVRVIAEAHRLGAFSAATWLRVLADAGFEPARSALPGDGAPANLFLSRRPD